MSVLAAKGLSVTFRGKPALRKIDLPDLAPGEVLGVIGPNGAGKSTLLRCLTGEIRTGDIRVDGRSLLGSSTRDWRRLVAYMPQTPPQAAALSPIELLISAARALDLELSEAALDARIEGVLAALELEALAFAHLSTLSGGQRQLVGFALALAAQPRLLVLDEPTSALDPRWRLKLLRTLRQTVAKGAAAVAVLHDLDLAAQFCDRLALLHEGRLLAAGAPEEVLTPETLAAAYRVEAQVEKRGDRLSIQLLRPLEA